MVHLSLLSLIDFNSQRTHKVRRLSLDFLRDMQSVSIHGTHDGAPNFVSTRGKLGFQFTRTCEVRLLFLFRFILFTDFNSQHTLSMLGQGNHIKHADNRFNSRARMRCAFPLIQKQKLP